MKPIKAWATSCDGGKAVALNFSGDGLPGLYWTREEARKSYRNDVPSYWRKKHKPRPVRVVIRVEE
jgi:hypothetical protein